MTATTQIFRDSDADRRHRAKWWTSRIAIYGVLIFFSFANAYGRRFFLLIGFKSTNHIE